MATGQTVVIGCKLPAGLILEIVNPNNPSGPIGSVPPPIGPRVVLRGGNSGPRLRNALGESPMLARYPYGLTTVDKDFWEAWYARNKDAPMVTNGIVFVAKDAAAARDMAEERRDVKTGLEPLSPKTDDKARGTDDRVVSSMDPSMKKAMEKNAQEIPATV